MKIAKLIGRALRIALVVVGSLGSTTPVVYAQSTPGFHYGQVPTADQWNAYFAAKQDLLGFVPFSSNGGPFSGPISTAPSTAGRAGFTVGVGVAPTSPNNGDIWTTGDGLYVQVGNATVGPLTGAGNIPAPSPTTKGGVFSYAPVDNQYVAGVDTSGHVILGGPPAPASTTIQVQNVAQLKTILPSSIPTGWTIQTAGYYTPGDRGGSSFTPSTDPCSLNGGAGDDGSQVKPTGAAECFNASLNPSGVMPRQWGADPTGTAEAYAPTQAALNAIAGTPIPLFVDAKYKINTGLSASATTTVFGYGGHSSQYDSGAPNNFRATCPVGASEFITSSNIDLITFPNDTGTAHDICFQMATSPGQRTSGAAIVVGGFSTSGNQNVYNNTIIFPYDGINIGGPGAIVGSPLAQQNEIIMPSHDGISVGRLGTGGGSANDARIFSNTVICQQDTPTSFRGSISGTTLTIDPTNGIWIKDQPFPIKIGDAIVDRDGSIAKGTTVAGTIAPGTIITAQLTGPTGGVGTYTVSISQTVAAETMSSTAATAVTATGIHVYNSGLAQSYANENYGCSRGTDLSPGLDQLVIFWGSGVQGDSSLFNDFRSRPTDSTAVLEYVQLAEWWASSAVSIDQPVRIQNDVGATVKNIEIGKGITHGTLLSPTALIYLTDSINQVSITNATTVPDAGGTDNIGIIDDSSSCVVITGGSTTSSAGTLNTGIRLNGSAGCKTVVGNELDGATTPIDWGATPTTSLPFVIHENGGVDDQATTVASGTAVVAPINPTFYVSGSTNVTDMSGYWNNRQLTIIPTGTFNMSTGGATNGKFCIGATAAALTPIQAVYEAPFNCWVLKSF